MVALNAGDVSASQTAGAGDLDTLCGGSAAVTGLHGVADGLLHGTAERDAALELGSDILSNQLSIGGGAFDLDDVEVDSLAGELGKLLLDLGALSTALADHDARLCAEDIDLHAGGTGLGINGTLDLDLGNAGSVQLLLQGLTDLVILDQGVAECCLEVNQRLSQSLITPTRMPWGLTFWPICLPPYSFSFSTTVMWLVRFRMRYARPCARGMMRLSVGPGQT